MYPSGLTDFVRSLKALFLAPLFFMFGVIGASIGVGFSFLDASMGLTTLSHFLISLGLFVIFVRCALSILEATSLAQLCRFILCLGVGVVGFTHLRHPYELSGVLELGNRSVETLQVNRGQMSVPLHLGRAIRPLYGDGRDLVGLAFGDSQRTNEEHNFVEGAIQAGGWLFQPQQPVFRSGAQTVKLRLTSSTQVKQLIEMRVGETYASETGETLFLRALERHPHDRGLRAQMDIIRDGLVEKRQLFQIAPTLDERLDSDYPHLAIVDVFPTAIHALSVHSARDWLPMFLGFALCILASLSYLVVLRRGKRHT